MAKAKNQAPPPENAEEPTLPAEGANDEVTPDMETLPPDGSGTGNDSAYETAIKAAIERRKGGENLSLIEREYRSTHPHISNKVLRRRILAATASPLI